MFFSLCGSLSAIGERSRTTDSSTASAVVDANETLQTTINQLFTLDIGYFIAGTRNQGGGLGLKYEHKVFDWFSLKIGFGWTAFKTNTEDVYCTALTTAVFFNYYPFNEGLNKLYIGIGSGCDFLNYFGDGVTPEKSTDTTAFLIPMIGYKYYISKWMFDVNFGYKIILTNYYQYNLEDFINTTSIQIGVGFKYFFKNK
ncbi:MAG: hypothetical protein LBQ77_07340 [Treponema sp.]|jgi:hypothetical protein|nr:hypothetical protein [Treponema sp.]